jgi:RNA polymerase sigma-70 factor (ECF subfamily)
VGGIGLFQATTAAARAPTQREPLPGRPYGVDMTESVVIGPLGDEDLVARAAEGDVAAFEAIVAPRLNRAFRTASAILGSEADAHDVVQEAFVATWRHLPRLRDRTKFDAWLHRMIVNRCRDALRRRRRSREVSLDGALDLHSRDSSDAAAGMAALTTAFERLSVDHRHLLVMHHLHRVPVADLAGELGIPEGTTKWRLHAARAALTRAMEADR